MAKKPKYQLLERLRDEEYAALEADIAKRGVLVPIEKDEDGNTLDGHHREEIAERLGKSFKTVTRKFKTEQEKREHVIKLNLARRHLEPHEWGGLFKRLLEERGVRLGKGGDRRSKETVSVDTAKAVAAELGVDDRTARNRMKSHDEYEQLTPTQRQAIKRRETTIKKAKAAKRREKTKSEEMVAAAEAGRKKAKLWRVTNRQTVVDCDALITDPPYGILDEPWEPCKLEEFTCEWASRWNDCGAGLIAVFWSQRHLWAGREWFDLSLESYGFQQLLVWNYPNNKSPQSRDGFKQTWEPVFFYRRCGCDQPVTVGGGEWGKDLTDFDCYTAAVPQENFNGENMKQHPAQKPVAVMRWLVNALTEPGQLVCDPFCGSGTTGVAAMQLGRRFHGIETNAEFQRIAEGRIAKYGKAAV